MSNFPSNLRARNIKAEILPFAFYSSVLNSAKSNSEEWNEAGLCPFHADRRPGSFFINLKTGAFNCYSCGAKGSDIIAFTQQHNKLSFVDALKKLQADWGLS
ncbi:MAG: hypothetical protein KGZ69_14760 [Methylomonas sp.]|nr:hypothetical protein [Methylomonas sp.]